VGARNGSQRVQPLSVLNRPRVSVRHQVVARYKLVVGKRINSATLIADARHSWLDALSSAGALVGLVAVAFGLPWGDPLAGLLVTAFICHVGYEVTKDVVHRLADGVDPEVITTAEAAAGSVRVAAVPSGGRGARPAFVGPGPRSPGGPWPAWSEAGQYLTGPRWTVADDPRLSVTVRLHPALVGHG